MKLDEIGNGRVYTHLCERLSRIGSASAGTRRQIDDAIDELNNDPVYQDISAGRFRSPVASCPAGDRLRAEFDSLRAYAESRPDLGLEVFLENTRKALDYRPIWDENAYFTVPVMAGGDSDRSPGMVYLAVRPLPSYGRAQGQLPIRQLTQDRSLLESTVDYFGMIATVLAKTLYFLQVPMNDPLLGLCGHSYELLFNCQITEGKSIGAATLAAFAIAYMHKLCGAGFLSAIAPEPGTLITGEIDRDGRVLPVEHLDEKVEYAIDEYGASLKVILPDGKRLLPRLENKIDSDRLYYVNTAEELLDAALSSPDRPDGLLDARKMLFSLMTPDDIARFSRHLVSDVSPEVYTQIRDGQDTWRTPMAHPAGVYALGQASRETLEVRIGLEPSALQTREGHDQRELIEVILDGSNQMAEHWMPGEGGTCGVTGALFAIANCFDPTRQELVCGFLSHNEFRPVRGTESAKDLEQTLQKVRKDSRLEYKGPFFLPAYEASAELYAHRLKRVFIISDSMIPDLDDMNYSNLSSLSVLLLGSPGNGVHTPENTVCLLRDDGLVDRDVIDRFFHKQQGKLASVKLDLGEALPVSWLPSSGELSKVENRFVLQWDNIGELSASLRVQLSGQHPRSVNVSGAISRSRNTHSFEFTQYLRPGRVAPIDVVKGTLGDEDFAQWERVCSARPVELLVYPENKLFPTLAIPGLRDLSGGYIALCAGSRDWRFFQTGCTFDDFVAVRLDRELHYSRAKGRENAIPRDRELYELQLDGKDYYFCGVHHHD